MLARELFDGCKSANSCGWISDLIITIRFQIKTFLQRSFARNRCPFPRKRTSTSGEREMRFGRNGNPGTFVNDFMTSVPGSERA